MPRLSTKVKRVKDVGSTKQKHRFWKGTTEAKRRMKSFETEEKARAWAKAEQLDEKTHELRHMPKGKWQWRPKNPRLA